MSAGSESGLVSAITVDLKIMHETWMEVFFPRQRGAEDTVLGKWEPSTSRETVTYNLWAALGIPVIALLYPLVLLGYFFRYQARKINVTAARLGFFGVVIVFTLLWGGLVALIYIQFSDVFTTVEIIAIAAASGVAVMSSALSFIFWRLGGRGTTVLLAYPFAVTAIFLPPVVAALFHPVLEDIIIARSDEMARWMFQNSPDVIQDQLGQIDRQEGHHVIIWFAISFPVGWLIGSIVTLANLIRPRGK